MECWRFKFSVDKTQVICFSGCQETEQVGAVIFLGLWFDEQLMWRQHIGNVRNKCKKVKSLKMSCR